jgi:hypothetical protein
MDPRGAPERRRQKMRYALAIAAILVVAVVGPARANPGPAPPYAYVSFDQTGSGSPVHEYQMTQYVSFNAYICFSEFENGVTTVSFALNNMQAEYPGLFASQSFTNLLDIIVGDPFTGMSLASSTCRTEPVVVVGYLNLFPIALGECWVRILEHPEFPYWTTDCTLPDALVYYYGLLADGYIYPPGSPVEDRSWGSIKAMYR